MATLVDASKRACMEVVFEPKRTPMAVHYRIVIKGAHKEGEFGAYCSLEDLQFMTEPYSEFDGFTSLISSLVYGDVSSFKYTPLDERDYDFLAGRFDIESEAQFRVYIHSDRWKLSESGGDVDILNSGFLFRVGKDELEGFCRSLTEEYRSVK